MTKEEIQEAVKNHKCHGAYFCTVATTGYSEEKRTRICTDCWNEIFLKISENSIDNPGNQR